MIRVQEIIRIRGLSPPITARHGTAIIQIHFSFQSSFLFFSIAYYHSQPLLLPFIPLWTTMLDFIVANPSIISFELSLLSLFLKNIRWMHRHHGALLASHNTVNPNNPNHNEHNIQQYLWTHPKALSHSDCIITITPAMSSYGLGLSKRRCRGNGDTAASGKCLEQFGILRRGNDSYSEKSNAQIWHQFTHCFV